MTYEEFYKNDFFDSNGISAEHNNLQTTIANDGRYLFIADRNNDRILNWSLRDRRFVNKKHRKSVDPVSSQNFF